MGRHTVPGSGAPTPDRGFWVRIVVAAVATVLVGGFALTSVTGGDDGSVGTAGRPASRSPGPTASQTSPASPSESDASATPSSSPTSSPTARAPTLAFTVRNPAYLTVRVPGGRTLVSKLFAAGATRSFDQRVLKVVNGRPRAVRFTVNGVPRPRGPAGLTETFTVRRR